MLALAFDYQNGMITMTCSAESNPKDSSMENTVADKGDRIVTKEVFEMTLSDGRPRYSTVCQLNAEYGLE